jgi:hypothetical protein
VTALRDPRRIFFVVALVVLVGAIAFGLWHVVVGGMLGGNARAAGFGVVLAAFAGAILVVLVRGRRART